MHHALAIDVGATKLAVGVVDQAGRLRARLSAPTPGGVAERQIAVAPDRADVGPTCRPATGEDFFDRLSELLGHFAPFDQYACCGIGSAGPMTSGGELISPLNIPAVRSFPLAERVGAVTGLRCSLDNDAKALALAEGWVGAAVGVPNYMAMVVSSGIGGGIVLNGRLLEGGSGNAGHIGQIVVAEPGRHLPSHTDGTLEAEASGTAIALHSGHPPPEATTAVVAEAGTYVGRAAGSVANLLDLQLVVVAGAVALGLGEPFFAAAQAEMDRICTLEFSRGTRIAPAGCGDEGPLIGGAAVGFRSIGASICLGGR